MKVGDKVRHDFLGNGEITDDLDMCIRGAFMVLFDNVPSFRYNMCDNPTLVFRSELTLQEKINE